MFAPGRLSTTTVWPNASASASPTMRAIASALPPGASGEMIRIGFEGYAASACPRGAAAAKVPIRCGQLFTLRTLHEKKYRRQVIA